jgi:hypothetical protein
MGELKRTFSPPIFTPKIDLENQVVIIAQIISNLVKIISNLVKIMLLIVFTKIGIVKTTSHILPKKCPKRSSKP